MSTQQKQPTSKAPCYGGIAALALLITTIGLGLATDAVHAADRGWNSHVGGSFNNPLSWYPSGVPGVGDTAIFSNISWAGGTFTYNVDFTSDVTNQRLLVNQGNVTFDLGGRTYALTTTSSSINDSSVIVNAPIHNAPNLPNPASLTLANGVLQSVHSRIGVGHTDYSFSKATVNVDGAVWGIGGGLTVGEYAAGELNIVNGGKVSGIYSVVGTYNTSVGTVEISGNGAEWTHSSSLSIGYYGTGSLKISNGAKVTNSTGTIGYHPYANNPLNGVGHVSVTGHNSRWTNTGELAVGRYGSGSLTIANGGEVSSTNGVIGDGTTGLPLQRTVLVSNGRWTNSGRFIVGKSGSGTLTIENGGVVSNTDAEIGSWPSSEGTVNVNGGAWISSGSLYVGGSASSANANGFGMLNIGNGGLVSVGGTLKLWNKGTVNVYSGGLLQVGTLDAALGKINFYGGTFSGSGQTSTVNTPTEVHQDTSFQAALAEVINYNAPITGSATVTKTGLGTVVQHKDSEISNVVVDMGAWKVAPTATLIANVVVNPGGTFGGGGVHQGNATVNGGKIVVGSSPGSFTTEGSTKIDLLGGTYEWEINSLTGNAGADNEDGLGWDLWNAGALTLDGALKISLVSLNAANDLVGALSDWNPASPQSWLVATSTNNAFADLSKIQIDPVSLFFTLNNIAASRFSLHAGDGNDNELYLHYNPALVPEPGTLALFAIAGASLCWLRRRNS